jgi:hypothetical protein
MSVWRCHSNSSMEGLGKSTKNFGTALYRTRPPEREFRNAGDATATFRTIQPFTRTHRGTPDTSVRLPISRLVFGTRTSGMQDCWRHSSSLRREMLTCHCILTSLRRTEETKFLVTEFSLFPVLLFYIHKFFSSLCCFFILDLLPEAEHVLQLGIGTGAFNIYKYGKSALLS